MNVLVRKRFSTLLCLGVVATALSLAGCGGDEESAAVAAAPTPTPSPSPAPSPGAGNQAPTISGSPLTTVMQGNAYSFTPNASDADGNTLTFTVTNLPPWATFNASTGRLNGAPTSADVGTYGNIRISVSDGAASANLAAFSIQVVGTATGSATLSWTPPTQNTDGSPLINLSGYRIYWGTTQGSYPNSVTVNNPGLATYVVEQLTPAQWYFTVTALTSAGAESSYSNTASKQVL